MWSISRERLYKNCTHEKQVQKTNAWGISDEIIMFLKANQKASEKEVSIILTDQKKKKYEITLEKALEVGQYFQFKEFEKQLFIPIKDFSK